MDGLGRLFDISAGFTAITDLGAAATTGIRFNMAGVPAVTVAIVKNLGTAGQDPTFTLYEHTAYTGGTSTALAVVDTFYSKTDTSAFDGSETWTKTTQTAASTITNAAWAEADLLLVFTVEAASLSDGYTHISVDVADTGAATAEQWAMVLFIPHDLTVQRTPANLPGRLS
jgi:hypothetical protein